MNIHPDPISAKTATLITAKPCPFCGWRELRLVDWADDDGEYEAIECKHCLGTAPATQWNNRQGDDDAAATA